MKPLAATWEQAQLLSGYMSPTMDMFSEAEREAILEDTQSFLTSENDGANDIMFAGDYNLKQNIKSATIALIHAAVNFSIENPAGTGSLSSESIGSISVGHTMAYNNAPWDEWLQGNIFGKKFYQLLEDVTPIYGITL